MEKKKVNLQACPSCGKNMNIGKSTFCANCGHEFYSPMLDKQWSYKVLVGIIIAILILYILFVMNKPTIYFYLDAV